MKSVVNFLCLLIISFSLLITSTAKASGISDTLHVMHYAISIDTINYSAQSIKGETTVTIQSKQNGITSVPLSLLQLQVDAVTTNGSNLNYTYNDTMLRISLPSTLNTNDSISITVVYHGQPKLDVGGWGGFHFSGNYAFNMGVGFISEPHSLGKVWFPCIDEFTDRAKYDFYITTALTYKAFCNGLLASQISNPNGTITWHWQFNQTMPTYLASIAVAPFYTLQRTSNGLNVQWACMAADTANTLLTFQHIDSILSNYISAYGSYPFDKVGFAEVPFNSGAMEHATSIHIGKSYLNGTLNFETLWAHELSHMWWGDKVTCETEGDMWLNEGFASFNEAFTTQKLYGDAAYKTWIRDNHFNVVHLAHIDDGSYLSFLNVPSNYTYGTTVYKKGADVIHTLRNYMGDSLFFAGCKYYLNNHSFANANSYQLRDDLTTASGINMNRFFDDWIFTPGFPHFSIDSVEYFPGGLDHYFVHTRQRSSGNNHLYKMPVDITFSDGVNDTTVTVVIDSATNVFHIAIVGVYNFISIDRNEKISDAITDCEDTITTTGVSNFTGTNFYLTVQNTGGNSSIVRVENNWVTPDGFKQPHPGIRLSDYHYWKVDGVFAPAFLSKATFNYNGSATANGHIDNAFITREDSMIMYYRATTGDDWKEVIGYSLVPGGSFIDKVGHITIDTLKKGEYVFGIHDYTAVGFSENLTSRTNYFTVAPNPSHDTFNISFALPDNQIARLQITNENGQVIESKKINTTESLFKWNAQSHKAGIYFVSLFLDNKIVQTTKLILAP